MTELTWQKSSFSDGAGDNCLCVAATHTGAIHLRESDAPTITLTTTPATLAVFIRTLTANPHVRTT